MLSQVSKKEVLMSNNCGRVGFSILFVIAFTLPAAGQLTVSGIVGGTPVALNICDAGGNPTGPTSLGYTSATFTSLRNSTLFHQQVRVYCYSVSPPCATLLLDVGLAPGESLQATMTFGCTDGKVLGINVANAAYPLPAGFWVVF
jgi:hypothetical protein